MKILKTYPRLFLLIAIIAISSASLMIRTAQQTFSSLFIASARLSIAGLILVPFQMKKKLQELRNMDLSGWFSIFLSSLFLAFHFMFWISSLETTSVITSVVLVTTTPIWVALLSPYFLNEKLTKQFYSGLIVAFVGIIVLVFSSVCSIQFQVLICQVQHKLFQRNTLFGSTLALLGAFCAAGYVLSGKKIRKDLSNLTYVTIVYLISGLICLVIFFANQPATNIDTNLNEWIPLILIAVIPQIIGHSLINAALGYLPAAHVSLALLGEPMGSTILAFIFLNEIPSSIEGIGAVVIILGIYLAMRKKTSS